METSRSESRRPGNDSRRCYSCGQEGHFAAKCTKAPVSQSSDLGKADLAKTDKPKDKQDRKCYNCHQKGHLARNCPSAFYCHSPTCVSKRGGGSRYVVGDKGKVGLGLPIGSAVDGCVDGNGGGEIKETKEEVGSGMVEGGDYIDGEGSRDMVRDGDIGGGGDFSGCNVETRNGGGENEDVECSPCGMPVTRTGTVEGREVDNIVLDTGCSRTMIHHDLLSKDKQLSTGAVRLLCAHGDVITYPLANVLITINGLTISVVAAVSKTLPVSVLLGTDVPDLERLLQWNPVPPHKDRALVMTRAQARQNEMAAQETRIAEELSEVRPNAAIEDNSDAQLFQHFHDDLFNAQTEKQRLTRQEKRTARHSHGLIRAKDSPKEKSGDTLPVVITREELIKLQDQDNSLAGVRGLTRDPSQPFYRKNSLIYRKWQ